MRAERARKETMSEILLLNAGSSSLNPINLNFNAIDAKGNIMGDVNRLLNRIDAEFLCRQAK